MKLFRITVTVLFVITSVLAAAIFVKELFETDRTIPQITVEEEMITVSLNATDEELLRGITAYDEKDKDLTDKVIIESVSRFIRKGVSKVTYAVCDSDNNTAKATRLIQYEGYESPQFSVKGNLCFSLFEHIDIRNLIAATDSLEGNISSKIIVTSDDYSASISGAFSLNVSVTNSKGDYSTITLPLIVEDRPLSVPVIELSEYLVYTSVGGNIDFSSYVVDALDAEENSLKNNITVESTVNFSVPGTYHVHYYATDSKGLRGHSVMTVIVEE